MSTSGKGHRKSSDDVAVEFNNISTTEQPRQQQQQQNQQQRQAETRRTSVAEVCRETIMTARMKEKLLMLLSCGFVFGWCLTGVDALRTNSRDDIEDLCSGILMWELLLAMVAVNSVSMIALVHIWFYRHFRHRQPYKHANVVIRIVILVQLIMTCWGTSILVTDCARKHLRPLLVYSVIYVWLVWQLFLIVTMFVIAICICLAFSGGAL